MKTPFKKKEKKKTPLKYSKNSEPKIHRRNAKGLSYMKFKFNLMLKQ